jgi:dinuclear metal center YbgI/SA1388 family protein
MDASSVVRVLESLAPLRLAASWDNVGLLLEGNRPVSRVLLCVDLTEGVLHEAIRSSVDLVVAYHPPLFAPIKRLTSETPSGRVLLGALRAGLAVYSPHTALDAAAEGMNDWLLEAFGAVTEVAPIQPDPLDPTVGAGRTAALVVPRSLERLLVAVKTHLGVTSLRIAGTAAGPIHRVAVCPGAGGSLFGATVAADLFVTGELRHHDVMALVAAGRVVVLAEHTHTERGYLPRLASRLTHALPALSVTCSRIDADPLRVY